MKVPFLLRLSLLSVVSTALSPAVAADTPPALPPEFAGNPYRTLEGGKNPPKPDNAVPLTGTIVGHTGELAQQSATSAQVRRKGYSESGMTLRYALGPDFPGGPFRVWAGFSTGGIGTLTFQFKQTAADGKIVLDTRQSCRNRKSWTFGYVALPRSIKFAPGPGVLELAISGRSGDAKNFDRVLLLPGETPEAAKPAPAAKIAPRSAPAQPAPPPPVPPEFAGKPYRTLEGGKNPPKLDNAVQLTGTVTASSGGTLEQSAHAAMVRNPQFVSSSITLRYALPDDFPGGSFRVWARFAVGGISTLNFDLKQTDATGKPLTAASRRIRNVQSWATGNFPHPVPITLAPGAGTLELTVSGSNSGAKIFERLLLLPESGVKLSAASAALRQKLLTAAPRRTDRRMLLLEGADGAAADPIFARLPDSGAVEYFSGETARTIAAALQLKQLPAAVETDEYNAALRFWDPVERIPGYPAPVPGTAKREPFGAAFLYLGQWAGVAGMSLLGVDMEATVSPCAGDPLPLTAFDRVWNSAWRPVRPGANGRIVLESPTGSYQWGRGTGYAFVYVFAKRAGDARLTVLQSGFRSAAWLNGRPAKILRYRKLGREQSGSGVTDQGNRLKVTTDNYPSETEFLLPLRQGVNRLNLKLLMEHAKGETFDFAAQLDAPGLEVATALEDPAVHPVKHAAIAGLRHALSVSAPANLPHPGEPLRLTTRLVQSVAQSDHGVHGSWPGPPPEGVRARPLIPFRAVLDQQLTDADGNVLKSFRTPVTVPGVAETDLGPAPGTGYYAIQTVVRDPDGAELGVLRPGGFSVIGGVTAQRERQKKLKQMTSFYWVFPGNAERIATWMDRIGIFHNVGSGGAFNPETWKHFAARNLTMTADFLDPWCAMSAPQRTAFVNGWNAHTTRYKAWNEIDISPRRPSAEKWTERTRREYEAVKAANPAAEYTGGTWVRVGNSEWFRKCLELGLDRYVDRWDVHAYPKFPPKLAARHITNAAVESGSGIETAYAALGKTNSHPFVLGETGARCSHGFDARRWQADTMAKMTAWCVASRNYSGLAWLIPWMRGEAGGDIPVAHHPGEAALYTVGALVDGFPYRRCAEYSEEVAEFGPTRMAWTTGKPVKRSFPLDPAHDYVRVDAVGRVTAVPRGNAAVLEITGSPFYLLKQSDYRRLTR